MSIEVYKDCPLCLYVWYGGITNEIIVVSADQHGLILDLLEYPINKSAKNNIVYLGVL